MHLWVLAQTPNPAFDGICAFLMEANFSRVSLVSSPALCVPLVPTRRCPNPCQPLGTVAFLFLLKMPRNLPLPSSSSLPNQTQVDEVGGLNLAGPVERKTCLPA